MSAPDALSASARCASWVLLRVAMALLSRLLVAGQNRVHAFPGRQEIEAAEFLLQLDRLVDDALLLVVITQLDIAGEREILAQRMPFETVIGQDPAQIGIVGEEHAEHVPDFALEPAGRAEDRHDGGYRRVLVGRAFDPDAAIELEADQVIDDLEPLRP